MRVRLPLLASGLLLLLTGCGRSAIVASNLPLQRVVVYRNGVAYFERGGLIDEPEVRFKMKEGEVGDFLATLAVMERGGSSVRAAAFPLHADDDGEPKPRWKMTDDEKKGLRTVVLSLDGKEHDLTVGYVAESPVWRPSYRLVVQPSGEADLQAWGIVQNLSGEDWKDVHLSLVAGAPLAFESTLGTPVIPVRPTVTDSGEVIASVPHAETSLEQKDAPAPPPPPAASPKPDEQDEDGDGFADLKKSDKGGLGAGRAGGGGGAGARGPQGNVATRGMRPSAKIVAATGQAQARLEPSVSTPYGGEKNAELARREISKPRDLRSLAGVAQEGGTTRYDIPSSINVPDRSATMVMLLSQKVPGEAIFLFAPDGGVPDSASHPFRVARFANRTPGALERGPIAVFEKGSFLGQGMVDPLPVGAIATVPFALERGVAVDQERKYDELGERVAKIENAELTVERDGVTKTIYRVRNGGDQPAKVLVKHPRINGARLFNPPKETEDNVGTGSALVPTTVAPRQTSELVVDERATLRRLADWFSVIADNAVKAYLADARSDRSVVAKLSAAWTTRDQIVKLVEQRQKLGQEQSNLQVQTDETRRNIKAIEKNVTAAALRDRLTKRLGEMALRLDEITKQIVETDSKLAELRVTFKEAIRDIKVVETPPPKP
jgi:hypothetical protein